jgi:hypothetical protein
MTSLWLGLSSLAAVGCRGTIYPEDSGMDSSPGDSDDAGLVNGDDAFAADGDPAQFSDPPSGDDGFGVQDDGGGATDLGPCPATLADRLSVVSISVAPDTVNTAAGGYFSYYTPPILSPRPGGSWLAWQAAVGRVHVTPLDGSDRRAGPDVTTEANELRGLSAHADGFAVMVQRGQDQMALVGYDAAGGLRFDTIIIGNNNHDQQGDKWVRREWGDHGRLVFFENRYAVYFGHTMNWGPQGEHQGDLLWYYDLSGNRSGGDWDWGCSHSLDVRLAYNGTRLGPVCLSDCYPTKAIWFNHQSAEIHPEPSGNCAGLSSGELGGLVATAEGFWLSFTSPEGRSSRDVGLVSISNASQVGPVRWLTDSAAADESSAKLARYGDNLLVAWQDSGTVRMAVVDRDGNFVLGPESVAASFNQQTDFVDHPSGDVGWAHGEGSTLQVYRLRQCP